MSSQYCPAPTSSFLLEAIHQSRMVTARARSYLHEAVLIATAFGHDTEAIFCDVETEEDIRGSAPFLRVDTRCLAKSTGLISNRFLNHGLYIKVVPGAVIAVSLTLGDKTILPVVSKNGRPRKDCAEVEVEEELADD